METKLQKYFSDVISEHLNDLQNKLDQAQGMLDLTQEELKKKREKLDQINKELDQINKELDQINKELDQVKKEAEQSARRGELTTLIKQCIKKMKKGTSVEDIADMLEEDFSVIQCICNIAEKYAPDYDVEKICREIEK